MDYLNSLELEGLDRLTFSEYLTNLKYFQGRLKDINHEIDELAMTPRYEAKVKALKCFRGIETLSAMTILTELDTITRFTPVQLMSYSGLTPSEHSSGSSVHRGRITRQGNSRLRHVIVEAAWHYLKKPTISKNHAKKLEGQDKEIVLLALKALKRLNKRFFKLSLKKNKNVAVVAIARELVGFIWAALLRLEA